MNYLLDTHTLIWSILENKKLSPLVKQALNNQDNSIFVSAITFWEIALKFSTEKLELKGILPEDFPRLSLLSDYKLLQLSADESATYHNLLKTLHRDPFDRMIIWQAINHNYTLISKDAQMALYEEAGLKIFW